MGSPRALLLPWVMLPLLAVRLGVTNTFCTFLLMIQGSSPPLTKPSFLLWPQTTKLLPLSSVHFCLAVC